MSLWQLTRRYGFHFISLISIVVFMLWGYSPTLSVFYATLMTFVLSFLTRETALVPKKLVRALADGSTADADRRRSPARSPASSSAS